VATLRRWPWIPIAGVGLLVPAFLLSLVRFKDSTSVTVQLIRREVSTTIRASQLGEAFKPRQVTVATVVNVMQSPLLLARVGSLARPPMTASQLRGALTIKPERDTDLITVTLKGRENPAATANLINLYAQEVVSLTAQMQSDEAGELAKFLQTQLQQTERDLEAINKELLEFSRGAEFYDADREVEAYLRQLADVEIRLETGRANAKALDFRIESFERELAGQSQVALALAKARDALSALLVTYTTNNPTVKDAQDRVRSLEAQLDKEKAERTNVVANFRYSENTLANDMYLRLLMLYGERETLAREQVQIAEFGAKIQEKLRSMPEKSQRHAQIMARQQSLQASRDLLLGRQREAHVYQDDSPGLYRLFAKATESNVETKSRWLKTIVVSAAGFVLGMGSALFVILGLELLDSRLVSAGDLKRVTHLPVSLRLPDLTGPRAPDPAAWRFRAWPQLLRELNLQQSPHVVVGIASAKAGEGKSTLLRLLAEAAHERGFPVVAVTNAPMEPATAEALPLDVALTTPSLVADRLRQQPGCRVALHCDSAWTWSQPQRERWHRALDLWRQAPSLALLVELPAITGPSEVLAAEMMPRLVWIAASGQTRQREASRALGMMADGNVRLAAAVLNREPALLSRLASLGTLSLAAVALLCLPPPPVLAAESDTNQAPPAALSASSQTPALAPWQERFTVGPGDIFHLRIYGRTDSIRIYVPVGPDGRISFLEAQSVPVAGLTVDEMRARLDEVRSAFYNNVRTIVTPVEWRSKKYYVLGAVVDRGAYTLDRPLTLIEAVARTRGIASGLFEHNTVDLADLGRAFIVRDQQRLPVDFEKLFHRGDLTQNILIAPGDYIYFPSGTVNEVYVLGAVRSPGLLGLTSANTLVGVLTIRGGLLPSAYKQRVLVIRGALQQPETFVVDLAAILTGREKDFILQPKDIVYVAEKPWQRAQEILQVAVNSFVQAMTTAWVNENVTPIDVNIPQL